MLFNLQIYYLFFILKYIINILTLLNLFLDLTVFYKFVKYISRNLVFNIFQLKSKKLKIYIYLIK